MLPEATATMAGVRVPIDEGLSRRNDGPVYRPSADVVSGG